MTERLYQTGDRVRHVRRPEWGIGSVVKAERTSVNGRHCQRLSVRFPNVGVKTLSTLHADLELAPGGEARTPNGDAHPLSGADRLGTTDWLAPLARRKLEEQMTSVPADARDPFNSLRKRLTLGLDLYRFDRTGRGLMEWAIAQTGISDPLSEFTRQELEQLFERWAAERDSHLVRLLTEVKSEPELLGPALTAGPPGAREAVRRLTAQR